MKAKPNRRRIELNLPIVTGATITRRRFLAGTGAILTGPSFLAARCTALAEEDRVQPPNTTRVRLRFVDSQTGQTTPAMVCITDANSNEVRVFVGKDTKKISGEKRVGDKIRAELTQGGFANSIQ